MKTMGRRALLVTTTLGGVAAIAGLRPQRALALRIEEDEVRERLYLAACEERAAHDQLVQDLIAQLEGQQGRERALETVRAMTCPVCGCPLGDATGGSADPS